MFPSVQEFMTFTSQLIVERSAKGSRASVKEQGKRPAPAPTPCTEHWLGHQAAGGPLPLEGVAGLVFLPSSSSSCSHEALCSRLVSRCPGKVAPTARPEPWVSQHPPLEWRRLRKRPPSLSRSRHVLCSVGFDVEPKGVTFASSWSRLPVGTVRHLFQRRASC